MIKKIGTRWTQPLKSINLYTCGLQAIYFMCLVQIICIYENSLPLQGMYVWPIQNIAHKFWQHTGQRNRLQ